MIDHHKNVGEKQTLDIVKTAPVIVSTAVNKGIDHTRRKFLTSGVVGVASLLFPSKLLAAESPDEVLTKAKALYALADNARTDAYTLLSLFPDKIDDGIFGILVSAKDNYEAVKRMVLKDVLEKHFPSLGPNLAQVYTSIGNVFAKRALVAKIEERERSLKLSRVPTDAELMQLQRYQIEAANAFANSWNNFPDNIKNWESQYRYARLCAYAPALSQMRKNWEYADKFFYYVSLALQDLTAVIPKGESREKLIAECNAGRVAIARNKANFTKVAFTHRNLDFENSDVLIFCNGQDEVCIHQYPSREDLGVGRKDYPVYVAGKNSDFEGKSFPDIALAIGNKIYDSRFGKIQISSS